MACGDMNRRFMRRAFCAALLAVMVVAPGAFADLIYFTYDNVTKPRKTGPVEDGNSTFGKWIANCGEEECIANPYTGEQRCYRPLSFWHEEVTFSSNYRSWPLRAQKNFSSDASWCRAVLVDEGAFVLTGSYYQLNVSFIGLDENGFADDGELRAIDTFSCGSSMSANSVTLNVGLTGTAMALLYCYRLTVFNRSVSTGLWSLLGDRPSIGSSYTYYPQIAPDASAVVLQRYYYTSMLFELTEAGSWVNSVTLPAVDSYYDNYILIDSTTLLQSQPQYDQPYYRSAGQIALFHRSAAFADWETLPVHRFQLDPGEHSLSYTYLQALDYMGDNKIYALYDDDKALVIDYSEIDDVKATRVLFCSDRWGDEIACPVFIKGRDQKHPAFFLSYNGSIIHPFGVGDTSVRSLFLFVVVGIPIIAVAMLIACCCCGKEIRRCFKRTRKSCRRCCCGSCHHRRSSSSSSSSSTSTTPPSFSTTTYTAPAPVVPSSSDTISNTAPPAYTQPPPAYPSQAPPSYSGASGSAEERLISALSTVRQGIVTALVGIAREQVSVDDAITIIALALTNALKQCQVRSESELRAAMEIITRYMGALLSEVISEESARNKLIGLSVQRAGEILSQQQQRRASNVEEALQFIRHSVEAIWRSVTEGKANTDQATALLVVVGLAALRNCTIESVAELRAHMDGFSRFMLLVADQCAPSVPSEVKRSVINQVWGQILSMF